MSLLDSLFGRRKKEEVFDTTPGTTNRMPARPYRVLQSNLPFYSDQECKTEVTGARLVVLQCEDPGQKQRPIECMPTQNTYVQGQLVEWEIHKDLIWKTAWYVEPQSGARTKAWAQATTFVGRVVKV
jgi:hypothetical protein